MQSKLPCIQLKFIVSDEEFNNIKSIDIITHDNIIPLSLQYNCQNICGSGVIQFINTLEKKFFLGYHGHFLFKNNILYFCRI